MWFANIESLPSSKEITMASNGVNGHVQKTAIVSGGASGIGLAMSNYFASQGYNVAVFDVTAEAGKQVVSQIASENPQAKVVFKKCDVSSWQNQADSFKEVYAEFGRIDVVCANAGISERGGSAMAMIEDDEPREPNLKIMDVNLTGVIYCEFFGRNKPLCVTSSDPLPTAVKLAIHYMNKNEPSGSSRGSIICTASNAGLYPFPVSPLYAASKSAVIGLVRSTAPVIERLQIQINALAPAVLGEQCLFFHLCCPLAVTNRPCSDKHCSGEGSVREDDHHTNVDTGEGCSAVYI